MYGSARWIALRTIVKREEPYCQSGVLCDPHGTGRRAETEVIDHIVPVRQRPDLMWERTNLQGLCKADHDRKTAMEDSSFVKSKPLAA